VLFDGGGGLAQLPHDLILDRTYIHGNATVNLSRCVALNSAASAVIDSYLSECHANGQDAQAICGWNGPGPFKIVNNYLEASGENVMFGAPIRRTPISSLRHRDPSQLLLQAARLASQRRVDGEEPARAEAGPAGVDSGKHLRELLANAQTGFAIVIWSVNQAGNAPWAVTQDVWFRRTSCAMRPVACNSPTALSCRA